MRIRRKLAGLVAAGAAVALVLGACADGDDAETSRGFEDCLENPDECNSGERADVYSLGAMLFELLAGRPPFPGDQPEAVARAVLQDRAPSLRRLMPQVPAAVSHLVQRMLAKQPLRRPSTAELLDALVKLEVEYFDEWQAAFDESYVLQRPPRAAG
jgi:serine/threonine protein kinase